MAARRCNPNRFAGIHVLARRIQVYAEVCRLTPSTMPPLELAMATVALDAPVEAPSEVLLVDDDELVLSAYARLLRVSGYAVTRANDGRAALQLVLAEPGRFDLVVSDIMMPGLDGMSFLRALRGTSPELPVILVTAWPTISSAAEAVEYGATRYLRKPIEWPALHAAVEHTLVASRSDKARRTEARTAREASARVTTLALHRALASLTMAFQPIVHSESRQVFAYEALMRPTESSMNTPKAVLDAAESVGSLSALGARVRALVSEVARAPDAPPLFVNLHPQDLLDEALFRENMPLSAFASKVVFELTERAPLDQVVDAVDRVERLRSMGFRIAIDDLGAGFAGLATLALIQPDFVKIDMSLVRAIDRDERRRKIVCSLAALCHDMNIRVIAEGVETVAECEALVGCGCELLQGYLFGRPKRSLLPPA